MARPRARVWAVVATVAVTGCTDWRDRVVPARAAEDPVQSAVEGAPNQVSFGSTVATLVPRARYRITAYALIIDDTMRDAWSDVARLDVALGWGPVASPRVLNELSFHLKRRYVSVRWQSYLPIGERAVMNHLANHHLVAANGAAAEAMGRIRPGDLVTLEGDLVDLTVNGKTMRTSLSRSDVGSGACEVLYVERVLRDDSARAPTDVLGYVNWSRIW